MSFAETAASVATILEQYAVPAPVPGQKRTVVDLLQKQKDKAAALAALNLTELDGRKLSAMSRAARHGDDVRLQFAGTTADDNFYATAALGSEVTAGLQLVIAQGLDPEAAEWV